MIFTAFEALFKSFGVTKICHECNLPKPLNEFALCWLDPPTLEKKCNKCEERQKKNAQARRRGFTDLHHASAEFILERHLVRTPVAQDKFIERALEARRTWEMQYGAGCLVCGSQEALTYEHLINLARLAGINHTLNLIFICSGCNANKSSKDPLIWLAELSTLVPETRLVRKSGLLVQQTVGRHSTLILKSLVFERLHRMWRDEETTYLRERCYEGLMDKHKPKAAAWHLKWEAWVHELETWHEQQKQI